RRPAILIFSISSWVLILMLMAAVLWCKGKGARINDGAGFAKLAAPAMAYLWLLYLMLLNDDDSIAG
ncbi:MAG: hypothetical protein CVV27_21920, partial [Candidatus Melainabacteria bacterium HGW-Melainabacteria-1]